MIAAPVQNYLPLRVELRLPTLTLSGVRAVLGLHENLIKEQVELGMLIAWDISRKGEGRREYRFLAASVRAWGETKEFDEGEIIRSVYGADNPSLIKPTTPPRPFIFGSWFCRCWNCDSGHMINLVADGTLALLPRTYYHRGRSGTPVITWSSAAEFLRSRRL